MHRCTYRETQGPYGHVSHLPNFQLKVSRSHDNWLRSSFLGGDKEQRGKTNETFSQQQERHKSMLSYYQHLVGHEIPLNCSWDNIAQDDTHDLKGPIHRRVNGHMMNS